ncbi:MAG TPA: HD domain-containing phosphohydrolase [Geobacteraceae bacterium]
MVRFPRTESTRSPAGFIPRYKSGTVNDSQLYNSRIIDAYIKLVKSRYGHVNIGELIDHAGMKLYEISDQGHWFSQAQIDRFHEKLVHLTGNPNIAREAGRYAASPEALGVLRQYALGLIDPANAFALVGRAASNFTRSAVYSSRKISANSVEITVTPLAEGGERFFQCANRIGFFEAVVLMFGCRLPDIRHTECMFAGAKVCRYVITWDMPLFATLRRARNRSAFLLLGINAALAAGGRWGALAGVLPASAVAVFLLSLWVERSEKRELHKSLDGAKDSIDRLFEQINVNYNNALMTNEIGRALSTYTTTEEILASVIQILEKRLDYDRGLILLADPERTGLELQAGFGYSDRELGLFDKLSFPLDSPGSKGVFVLSFREQKPYLVNDLADIGEGLPPRSLAFAKKLGTRAFICCPIVREDTSIGILAVDNVKSKRLLVQSDLSLLMGIASVIAVSIRNAELIDTRMRQFNSILQALAASIDARDTLTAGHSEKVTEYALGICGELGLPGNYREMIRVAALLHDYGKIGVPDAILKKEGRLTGEEYEIVKTHAARTSEILSQIHFEGIYCEVPEIAGAHHEKVDGSGYPHGLTGKDIPLGAKIIAVADYFEAITAKRHYREPMAIDRAFALLREGVGSHFEERMVEALVRYYTRTHLERRGGRSSPDGARRRVRVPYRTRVSFRLNGRTSSATSEDISASGIYLATEHDVREGTPLEISISLPDDPAATVEATGRVAWVNGRGARKKPEFPAGFGVELLEFRNATGNLLNVFMSSYSPAAYARGR